MPESCKVLIAAADLLPALRWHAAVDGEELLTFTDAEALRALEVIATRRPSMVVLERGFAATPRGAALINRIKADPSLAESAIRVVSYDADYARVPPKAGADVSTVAVVDAPPPGVVPADGGQALDAAGTRRAPRISMAPGVHVLIDGNPATLVDLSLVGAQVISATVLKPNQRVRMTLSDSGRAWRVSGTITWALFEIPPRYRAGVEFINADAAMIDAFCLKHKA